MEKEYLYEGRAMGSDLSISIVTNSKKNAEADFKKMIEVCDLYEKRFSRFISESELSDINKTRVAYVSKDFMEVILIARELFRETNGVFNPLVNIAKFGYGSDLSLVKGRSFSHIKNGNIYDTNFESITINQKKSVVELKRGQQLDMGGFLKGLVAERMLNVVGKRTGIIVNIGGDIFVSGNDENGQTFCFEVENPIDSKKGIQFVYSQGAIATSGSYRRNWSYEGKPFFHILDKTGKKNPKTNIVSATVLSPHGYEADAYATTALILGHKKAPKFLDAKKLDYLFILNDGLLVVSSGFKKRLKSNI